MHDATIGPRPFGKEADEMVSYHARRLPDVSDRLTIALAWATLVALALAHWLIRWPLGDAMAADPSDIGFTLLQPLIWLGVAALAGITYALLNDEIRLHLLLALIAAGAGVLHFIVLVVAGVMGSFADSTVTAEILDLPRNILHVVTFVAAAELARAVLFELWSRWRRDVAFVAVTLVFFVTSLTAAQHTPWGTLEEFRTIVGGVWIPALAISIIATSLVEIGGPTASFGYRIALTGLLWVSPALPDLEWWTVALVGALTPWAIWRLIDVVYRRTPEGKHHLGPPGKRPRSKLTQAFAGATLLVAIVTGGLVAIFGTGFLGYRTQIIVDTSMEPDYEIGDVILVQESVTVRTLDVGDVVIVRVDDEPAVRRIIEISGVGDERMFVTQADGDSEPEAAVTGDELLGGVVLRIPDIGHPILELRD